MNDNITENEFTTQCNRRAADIAMTWLHTPYHHQMSCKGVGTDCLGLIRGVWHELYGKIGPAPPPYSASWIDQDEGKQLIDAARHFLIEKRGKTPEAGNVLLFRPDRTGFAKHLGIYVGEEKFVHAYWNKSVSLTRFGNWWKIRLVGIFAFPSRPRDLTEPA